VIAVAALRHAGTKVGFSSLGPEVAVSAPGGNCVNTARTLSLQLVSGSDST
jgi:serine protease